MWPCLGTGLPPMCAASSCKPVTTRRKLIAGTLALSVRGPVDGKILTPNLPAMNGGRVGLGKGVAVGLAAWPQAARSSSGIALNARRSMPLPPRARRGESSRSYLTVRLKLPAFTRYRMLSFRARATRNRWCPRAAFRQ
jgi:hypothetical protein